VGAFRALFSVANRCLSHINPSMLTLFRPYAVFTASEAADRCCL